MVNTSVLDLKIEQSGLRTSYIIEKIGISKQAFYKKKENKTPFRIAEMYVLSDLLNLSDQEKQNIFFADEVN